MANVYVHLKLVHMVGVILFMGSLVLGGWWKRRIDRSDDVGVVAFGQRQVSIADLLFGLVGYVLVLVSGFLNAWWYFDYHGTFFLFWGLTVFLGVGISWGAVQIPAQRGQARLAREAAGDGEPLPERYRTLGRRWAVAWAVSVALSALNLGMMIYKPA